MFRAEAQGSQGWAAGKSSDCFSDFDFDGDSILMWSGQLALGGSREKAQGCRFMRGFGDLREAFVLA